MKELVATMERSARERADAILADARAEADRIRADAEREVERRRSERRERVERAAAAAAAHDLAEARRAARRRALTARAEALDRVFDRAREHLAEPAARDAWRAVAPEWLARALAHAPPGEATVECDPATATVLAADAPPGLAIEAREASLPGLVVRGGSVEIDATPAGRLERSRGRLAIEILAAIRAGEGGG